MWRCPARDHAHNHTHRNISSSVILKIKHYSCTDIQCKEMEHRVRSLLLDVLLSVSSSRLSARAGLCYRPLRWGSSLSHDINIWISTTHTTGHSILRRNERLINVQSTATAFAYSCFYKNGLKPHNRTLQLKANVINISDLISKVYPLYFRLGDSLTLISIYTASLAGEKGIR